MWSGRLLSVLSQLGEWVPDGSHGRSAPGPPLALGKRNQATTDIFIEGLRHATAHGKFQISTDGFQPYRTSIPNTLEDRASFATITKVYRATAEGERRYSPAEVVATEVVSVMGDPDPKKICTSSARTSP